MEERLDKLIALMELQNKAWEHALQLLNGIHTIVVEKQLASDKLLQEHPTVMGPGPGNQPPVEQDNSPVDRSATPYNFNYYSDDVPYGEDMEEERTPEAQSFPVAPNAREPEVYQGEREEEVEQNQLPPDQPATNMGPEEVQQESQPAFREAPPTVPVTSKAEMIQQAEKKEAPPEPQ